MKLKYDRVVNLTTAETRDSNIEIEEDCCGCLYAPIDDGTVNLTNVGGDINPYIYIGGDDHDFLSIGHVIELNYCPECGEEMKKEARSTVYRVEKPTKIIKKVEKTKKITYFEEEEVRDIEIITLPIVGKMDDLIRKYPGLIHEKMRKEFSNNE